MATTFWRDGHQITADFLHGSGESEVRIPFANLLVWDNATLASYGVTKVVTTDVPQVISDRQFFHRLEKMGLISEIEALNAVQVGTLPSLLEGFVQQLPGENQFDARMILSGATEFRRDHPLVEVFGTAFGWTPSQIDDFWIQAYAL
jgi:hypothetical protein